MISFSPTLTPSSLQLGLLLTYSAHIIASNNFSALETNTSTFPLAGLHTPAPAGTYALLPAAPASPQPFPPLSLL